MPYVHRRVKAGRTIEHRKFQSFRVHTKGVKRGPSTGTTSEKQAKINERVSEEHLRWDLNANFGSNDLHAALHYFSREVTFARMLKDKKAFLKNLRRLCEARGIKYKYVMVLETEHSNHLHLVISCMDKTIIENAWAATLSGGAGGHVTYKKMDGRGNHYELAAYLMKESRSTMERYRKLGIRGKRYSKSQNMVKPVVTYEVVPSSSWRKEPKARKGATLYKFDDGSDCRSGWHEANGYPYQEYFEIFGEEKPPGGQRAGPDGIRKEKVMYYRTCPSCGANLDPGERCDCRDKPPVRQVPGDLQKKAVCSARNTTDGKGGKQSLTDAVSASTITENGGNVK